MARRNNGWYPAFIVEKFMAPREHPRDWLMEHPDGVLVGYVETGKAPRAIVSKHKVGDVVKFDHWQGVGSTIVSIGPKGPRAETPAPEEYDSVWNPRDPLAREWPTLEAFIKAWDEERGEETTVAVEFVSWERGVPFRIGEGLSAEAVAQPEDEQARK